MERKFKKEEDRLVKKLKKNCFGNERELEPSKCALIYHKLGNLFHERIDEKAFLVLGAIMYNAAIARSSTVAIEAKKDLNRLCSSAVKKAGAKNKDLGLVAISMKVKEKLKLFREKNELMLQELKVIPEEARGAEVRGLEEKKISQIQSVQRAVTADYIALVYEMAESCAAVIGKAPCKFALLGHGAIARNEITPYSSIEVMIVLQRGSQSRLDFVKVQNYFNWFLTIFNIVVVNLGESPCTTDAALAPNELNPLKGVVVDRVTPYGIYVDRLGPSWLIIPENGEKILNSKGYGNHKILSPSESTCFIYGNLDVYDDYLSEKRTTVASPKQIAQQLQVELNVIKSLKVLGSRKISEAVFDPRTIVRDAAHVFASAFSLLFDVDTSVDVSSELLKNSHISEKSCHQLSNFFSVSSELRLKLSYHSNKQFNVDFIPSEDISQLLSAVGKKQLIEFFWIAWTLRKDLNRYMKNPAHSLFANTSAYFADYGCLVYGRTCFHLRLYNDCINRCSLQLPRVDKNLRSLYLFILGEANMQLGLCQTAVSQYEEILDFMRNNPEFDASKELIVVLRRQARGCMFLRLYDQAIGSLQNVINLIKRAKCLDECEYGECKLSIASCYLFSKKYDEVIDTIQNADLYFRRAVMKNKQLGVQFRIVTGRCIAAVDKGVLSVGELQDALTNARKLATNESRDPLVADAIDAIGYCLMKQDRPEEAWKYLKENIGVEDRVVLTRDHLSVIDIPRWILRIGRCLIKLKRPKEAITILQRGIAILRSAPDELRVESMLAREWDQLAHTFAAQGRPSEALKVLKQAVTLEDALKSMDPFDMMTASAYHRMGIIYRNLERWNDAEASFEAEKKVLRAIPQPRFDPSDYTKSLKHFLSEALTPTSATPFSLVHREFHNPEIQLKRFEMEGANSLELAICLKKRLKFMDAINVFKEALSFFRKSGNHPSKMILSATVHCMSNMGEVLVNMERPVESLRICYKALACARRACLNPGADRQTLILLECIKASREYLDVNEDDWLPTPLVNHVIYT